MAGGSGERPPAGIAELLERGLATRPRPLFAGAVAALDAPGGREIHAAGQAHRYADHDGTPLPPVAWRAVQESTLFDLASLTKLVTATLVVLLADEGRLSVDDLLVDLLPEASRRRNRRHVTVRQLLTHTAGLPADVHYWRDQGDPAARRAAILTQPLVDPPGTAWHYSCVGYLTLGLLVEHLLGQPLDAAVQERVCGPLGMSGTGYLPLLARPGRAATSRDAIAATEVRRDESLAPRGGPGVDPRGTVHDENAAALGGVAGNAGIFAPATDLLRFGRALLTGLRVDGAFLGLPVAAVRELVRPQLPRGVDPGHQSGLGFRIDDRAFMGALAGRGRAYGHTGFTGTSLVLDEDRDLVLVLLTNRVHPDRTWSQLQAFRRQLADLVAAGHGPTAGALALRRPDRSAGR